MKGYGIVLYLCIVFVVGTCLCRRSSHNPYAGYSLCSCGSGSTYNLGDITCPTRLYFVTTVVRYLNFMVVYVVKAFWNCLVQHWSNKNRDLKKYDIKTNFTLFVCPGAKWMNSLKTAFIARAWIANCWFTQYYYSAGDSD